ncbi:radical SAM protein [Treponema bryantii]|uniref:radical SAM protein n=1 Tax=Treponema bryantii TaxID=163 RepID=UPI0003B5F365|nr:radical SAM protein [Treponema bryantii]
MKVLTIIPPIMQLNTAYPSGAYLTSFFKTEGCEASWCDLNIRLFYEIFSAAGLRRLFELSEARALQLADQAERKGDDNTAFNLRRYISQKENWIEWIDFITAVLCGGGAREKEHQFLYSPFAPRGSRMENYLAGLAENGREPTVDDMRFLCSFALADLSDYITVAFDPQFSLVRYAESLAVDTRTFSDFEAQIDSPVMEHFYKPVLEKMLLELPANNIIFCISIPFAGTFLPALYTARYLKEKLGSSAFVCIGGGFVNTELREARDPALAKYIDAISYDRGYGSYHALLEACHASLDASHAEHKNCHAELVSASPLYKLRLFTPQADSSVKVTEPLWQTPAVEKYENEITAKIIPDYSDIDFSIYPRMCDDANAMHRIWTDGAWIKAYLAHGCYWHRCAFCDTTLDYVCGYKPTDIEPLFNGLLKTARDKGVYGIHFVDEALPPVALKKFALLNARSGNPLYFWGNVRFEKTFTKDLAAFLSYCGLGGVSAGIESATGTGLEAINKGTDISSIIRACCAFKEAGILVHAYMIYGFWNDTPQTIIDSMETLRQFFEAGLLDSAFWHKFVLTRNSTVYNQWQKEDNLSLVSSEEASSAFARNNLHFKGEEKFNKFGTPLETALNCWMHGDRLDQHVQKWFDFQVPKPTVNRSFINSLIEKYEEKNRQRASVLNEKTAANIWWLGGTPVLCGTANENQKEYRWLYLMEEQTAPAANLEDLILLLKSLRPEAPEADRSTALAELSKNPQLIKQLKKLHGHGLVLLDF